MQVVETIAKIHPPHFRQGKSIKAICRQLKVSRKVVRKVLRRGATGLDIVGDAGQVLLADGRRLAEASVVTPLSYLLLVWASILSIALFDERLTLPVLVDGGFVVFSGLYVFWHERGTGKP